MVKIFANQTSLTIKVITYVDLCKVKCAKIRFRKPNGSLGEFLAVLDTFEAGTLLHHCSGNDLDMAGWWHFWAYIEFEDGRVSIGEAAKLHIWREGI